jgi:hypothetical protein
MEKEESYDFRLKNNADDASDGDVVTFQKLTPHELKGILVHALHSPPCG